MPSEKFRSEKPSIPLTGIVAGVALLAGIGVYSLGFWLAWHPLGFIVCGLSVSAVGVLLGRRTRPVTRRQA